MAVAASSGAPLSAQEAVAVAAPSELVTNETVLRLLAAGLPDEAVIAKIRTSRNAFDLSTDKLIELKSKGVSGGVMAAMLAPVATAAPEFSVDSADAAVPHYPGVYMFGAKDNRMTRMMATSSNQAKTGGMIGYAFTMGIASLTVKATIPGASAKIQTANVLPVFYLFFDESVPRAMQGSGSSIWTTGNGSLTTSPEELSLVRFTEKPGAREARVGSANIGGIKQGVMDKDRIGFVSELIRPGVFKVTPTSGLQPGEYGFIQALTGGNVSGGGGAMTARVFDFGITG
ncbi:MAG: hypothetical protein DCF31_15670 [Alphaproteobacteria bacterium]|nr:MAG: hypothetical protein DCF31_15670 [Alphaproteobacteria bacterium]